MKIGIDIGGSHIGIGLVNCQGEIIAKEEQDINCIKHEDAKKIIEETILILIEKLLETQKITKNEIESIGISFPGEVTDKCIVKAENLGIKDFNIVDILSEKLNLPVTLRNDAKCAGLAEKEYGSIKDVEDAVFLVVGTGIGGAIFIDGKLLKPKNHAGGEIRSYDNRKRRK